VSISRYSPVGAYGGGDGGSVYVRGSGTARPGGEVRIYTDGVPRFSGVWEHPIMDIVPIDFADRITVARNPQPQHYPGAFGAVDIATRQRLTEGHEGELDITYGRYNTLISAASVGGKIDLFDYYAGASYKYTEGARDHGAAELRSAFARAGWDLSERDHLSYIYNYTDNGSQDPGPKGGPKPVRDQFNTRTDTHALRLDSDRDFIKGYAMAYFDDGEIRWHQDNGGSPNYSNTDWHNYGFRSLYDILPTADLTLTAGLDWWSDGGRAGTYPDTGPMAGRRVWGFDQRFFTAAPYLGGRYDIGVGDDWTLTPALGSRYYISNAFDNEWAPNAALTLEKEGWQFYVSHARGVHFPGIYMFGTSPATWKSLDAETLDTTELGAHIDIGTGWSIQASLLRLDVDDRMDSTANGYVNAGSLTANGVEASLHGYPTQTLSVFAGGTYMDPEDHPVSRMPEVTLSAGASWQAFDYVRFDLDGEYVTTQYGYSVRETPAPATLEKLDDYLILNARVALDLRAFSSLHGELYVALENFTNQHYEYFPGYPMPGVMWYTGMKLKF
jgi:iron complex outermembrane receptor protein